MRWAAAVAAMSIGPWLAPPAAAQQMTLEPSAAVSCLTPAAGARGAPEYPFAAVKAGKAGRVKVALTFTTPQTRPHVAVLGQEGDEAFVEAFVDAVEQHVRDYRVPCHTGSDSPVRLLFDFHFLPDSRRVSWAAPVDETDALREGQLQCIVHNSGDKKPVYPMDAQRGGVQGRVLVRLRFEAPDRPPAVEVFPTPPPSNRSGDRRLTASLEDQAAQWVAGYRMPCQAGAPVSVVFTFVYTIEGMGGYGFKPGLSLADVLPLVRGIRQQTLDFDTQQMGCPFDVSLDYRQPAMANRVGELGPVNPARRPLIDWLSKSELEVPQKLLASFYGDTTTLHVPCLKIDLKPQE